MCMLKKGPEIFVIFLVDHGGSWLKKLNIEETTS